MSGHDVAGHRVCTVCTVQDASRGRTRLAVRLIVEDGSGEPVLITTVGEELIRGAAEVRGPVRDCDTGEDFFVVEWNGGILYPDRVCDERHGTTGEGRE